MRYLGGRAKYHNIEAGACLFAWTHARARLTRQGSQFISGTLPGVRNMVAKKLG